MSWLIGILLALSAGSLGTLTRLDRERGFYPLVTMIVGSYYVLFAAMAASTQVLIAELLTGLLFIAAAIAGFRWSLWIVVAALAAHGLFDFAHDHFIVNAGVPHWWPGFCAAYDLTAAAVLALLLLTGRQRAAVG
jgi:hypothetical protein